MTTTTRQTTTIPAMENESWGFWGCLEQHAADAWPLAMTKVAEATGEDLETVRAFLDSRHGRHFVDDVLNALDAGRPLAGTGVGRCLGVATRMSAGRCR